MEAARVLEMNTASCMDDKGRNAIKKAQRGSARRLRQAGKYH
jgi:hypothetical protein